MTENTSAVDRSWLLQQFVAGLESANVDYVLVGRVNGYPEQVESDVDFVVRQADFDRLPALLARIAQQVGGRLVQHLHHEIGAAYFAITVEAGPHIVFLHPDASADYRRKGRLWISADELLRNRRRHPGGFWIPGVAEGLLYYLVKRIDKGVIEPVHLAHLRAEFALAPQACEALLRDRLGAPVAAALIEVLGRPEMNSAVQRMQQMKSAIHGSAQIEGWGSKLQSRMRDLARKVRRVVQPTGLVIGFLGPDGSGKSTLIEHATRALLPAFRQQAYFHLRPRRIFGGSASGTSAVTDPHGKPPRGALASTAKLCAMVADYTLGYLLAVVPLRIRSALVIFDRYLHDMQADPRRYRWGGPQWMLKLAARIVPEPDLWVVLDAPVDVLLARKAEVSAEAAQLQRDAYRALARELHNCVLIDTSRPLEQCVADVNHHVLRHLSERTRRRLALPEVQNAG